MPWEFSDRGIFAYYDVMVADGSILTSPEEWEERVVPTPHLAGGHAFLEKHDQLLWC